jgi:hypothetical protein
MVYVYDISNPAKPREMMVLEVGLETDVSGKTLSFEGFSNIKKFCEDLKNSHFSTKASGKV